MKRKGIILAGGSGTRFQPLNMALRHMGLFTHYQMLNQLADSLQT